MEDILDLHPLLIFFMVNNISNARSSLYDPLHAIVMCYRPWLVPVYDIYSHYWWYYLMLDPLRLVNFANHTDQTWTKGLYIPIKVSGFSVYTSTVFNSVYTKQGKADYCAHQSQVQTITIQNTKSINQRLSSLSLSGYLQRYRPCLVDVSNHTYQTRTKGLYIPRKFSGYSVYTSNFFNGVYTKKGKVEYLSQ